MLPVERRHRIKQLIIEHEHMKISELSETLDVSEMTIHRDVKPLIDEGIALKTFGGISLSEQAKEPVRTHHSCVICKSDINARLAYRMILNDNRIEVACCAHCGLMRHRQLGDEVAQAMCYDFLKQTTMSVGDAWYVMDTSLDLGCCHPQVLTFDLQEHAVNFVKGFGGTMYNFADATLALHKKMEWPMSSSFDE